MVLQLEKWEVRYPEDPSGEPLEIVLYTDQTQTASDAERACALHALIDSAAMVLVKKYATRLREWTASEEADLAKLQEREVISHAIQRACRDKELVIFQKRKREATDDDDGQPPPQMPKIMWKDAQRHRGGGGDILSEPGPDHDWALVGGILNFKRHHQPTMIFEETNVDIEDLLDLPDPGVAAASLNATGATLERRQLRHYMLDLAGSLQVHFDKDTLSATDNILARIKENDASSTRTLSIEGERKTDLIEAINSIHDVIFSVSAKPVNELKWQIVSDGNAAIDLTFEEDKEIRTARGDVKMKLTENANFSITCELTYPTSNDEKTDPLFTISNLDTDAPTATIESKARKIIPMYLANYTFQPKDVSKKNHKLIARVGSFRIMAFDKLPRKEITGLCDSTYSKKCYVPAMESHRNNHITVKTAKTTASVFTENKKGTFGNEDFRASSSKDAEDIDIADGIELVPIHDAEIDILTAGEDIHTYHFRTAIPGDETFEWVIGGCPTTLLDGAASAVAFLQHTLRSESV